MIAAAGYIINDYFDLNIDQVNKPGKVVVNVIINRRWVIFWHMFLSLLGLFFSFAALPLNNYWHLVIGKPSDRDEAIRILQSLSDIAADDYWNTHYHFKEESKSQPKYLGRYMADNLIINTKLIGGKGNKNGVAVSAIYGGGITAGLLKPYYLNILNKYDGNKAQSIKYNGSNDSLFLDPTIITGSGGFFKGWGEVQVVPGAHLRTALRFDYGRPEPVDWDEPQRVAEAIHLMTVKHAVITSVDRDELKDGGSIIWYNTIKAVKALNPGTTLETLIPDFRGNAEQVQRIIDAAPEVVSCWGWERPKKK
eukprot:jgi/Mesen1/551/ME001047S10716